MVTILGDTDKRTEDVRRLIGGLDTDYISDEQIQEEIEKYDNVVMGLTNKFDWVSTDQKFKSFLVASDYLTSAAILDGVPGTEAKKIESQRALARSVIAGINKKDSQIQQTSIANISDGVNITNELDPDNYTPEQDVFS